MLKIYKNNIIYYMTFNRYTKFLPIIHTRILTNNYIHQLLLGAGISYSIQNEKYLHIPLIILSPSIYAGYHCYKNKDKIKPKDNKLFNYK